jgi:hypothetical protein
MSALPFLLGLLATLGRAPTLLTEGLTALYFLAVPLENKVGQSVVSGVMAVHQALNHPMRATERAIVRGPEPWLLFPHPHPTPLPTRTRQ